MNNSLNLTQATDLLTPDGKYVLLSKMREYLDLYTSSTQFYPNYIVLKAIDYFAYERTMFDALNLFAPAVDNKLPEVLRFDGIMVLIEKIKEEPKPQQGAVVSPIQQDGNQTETKNS